MELWLLSNLKGFKMLVFLNYFFLIFHTALIFFNLFGWLFKKTRKWNLLTLGLTAFSWFIVGFWYGFGYCFCTDWHWQVRAKLGYPDPPNSYIQFLVEQYFNWSPNPHLTDILTMIFFTAAVSGAIIVNLSDWFKRKKNS